MDIKDITIADIEKKAREKYEYHVSDYDENDTEKYIDYKRYEGFMECGQWMLEMLGKTSKSNTNEQ